MIYDWTWQLLKKITWSTINQFLPLIWGETPYFASFLEEVREFHHIHKRFGLRAWWAEWRAYEEEKKKANKDESVAGVTMKNFGSNVSVPKVKGSSLLKVAWRCRLDNQADGSKLLMPVRPIAILSGMLEVEAQNVSLLWKWNSMVDDVDLLGTWPWKGWEQ